MKNLLITLVTMTATMTTAVSAHANIASWYGGKFHGKRTASGEIFNQHGLTVASNTHKLGSKLKVTNRANGKSVIVRVTDRGGFAKYGRTLDLSKGAFQKIASLGTGAIKVDIEKLH
ncbi:rare lipoprotein A family protein [Moraxella macacae 0408225]|uniref:Endolytic peptidoglycan transglycosylase RlpA n=1 Tax=Moraxella macacae 0408225 TaxID=1230338 RepID=L2F773_9GAMM|nr:septal ring lytic transglycosylase RlpA family protein [Moraxella macacae]ELA08934.1 rare lipoprotein A family protein [Moraxella macacae 0408225]